MKRRTAFTLIELLIVVAIILILVALMFPVFSGMRERNRQFVCLSNMRQLGISYLAYAIDHKGKMVGGSRGPLDWIYTGGGGNPDANPTNWIRQGALYPYVGSVTPYFCPSYKGRKIQHYSIPGNLNPHNEPCMPNVGAFDQLTSIGRQMLFVEETDNFFVYENWGAFMLNTTAANYTAWTACSDFPAWNRHRGKWMNIVFLDGHGEMWQATSANSIDSRVTNQAVQVQVNTPDFIRFAQAFWLPVGR